MARPRPPPSATLCCLLVTQLLRASAYVLLLCVESRSLVGLILPRPILPLLMMVRATLDFSVGLPHRSLTENQSRKLFLVRSANGRPRLECG